MHHSELGRVLSLLFLMTNRLTTHYQSEPTQLHSPEGIELLPFSVSWFSCSWMMSRADFSSFVFRVGDLFCDSWMNKGKNQMMWVCHLAIQPWCGLNISLRSNLIAADGSLFHKSSMHANTVSFSFRFSLVAACNVWIYSFLVHNIKLLNITCEIFANFNKQLQNSCHCQTITEQLSLPKANSEGMWLPRQDERILPKDSYQHEEPTLRLSVLKIPNVVPPSYKKTSLCPIKNQSTDLCSIKNQIYRFFL